MSARYVLALQAAQDLVEVWRYIKEQSSTATADRVDSTIKNRIAFLSQNPGAKGFDGPESEVLLSLLLLDRLSA